MMKYRLLNPDEWDRLHTIVAPEFIPHSNAAAAAVAEDDEGNILGVLFLQIALHMEPLVLTSPRISFEKLHDVLYQAVAADKGLHFYCFSDKEIVAKMANHVGMKELPYKVFEQVVT